MASNNQTMELDQFSLVAKECKRWSDRSLSVAKLLLVEKKSPPEVAEAFEMTADQARAIKARFLKKAEKVRLAEFMKNETPKNSVDADLSKHLTEIQTLHDSGYTPDQINSYLSDAGVSVTLPRIRDFLKSLEGDK